MFFIKKLLLNICGLLFVLLAIIGILLPGLPTTIFLLLAATCFAKSSPKLYHWLLSNKIFGPIIKNWRETRTIPRRAKKMALVSLFIVSIVSFITLPHMTLKIIILSIMIIPVVILCRLKETEGAA